MFPFKIIELASTKNSSWYICTIWLNFHRPTAAVLHAWNMYFCVGAWNYIWEEYLIIFLLFSHQFLAKVSSMANESIFTCKYINLINVMKRSHMMPTHIVIPPFNFTVDPGRTMHYHLPKFFAYHETNKLLVF